MKKNLALLPACFLCLTSILTGACRGGDGNPVFDGIADIGQVSVPGTMEYDAREDVYTVSAAGVNLWFATDAASIVWMKVRGDFEITGDIDFVGEGVNPHRKMGFMIREDLSADCAYADIAVHGDGLTSLQYRSARGEDTFETGSVQGKAPTSIYLARRGDIIAARSGKGTLPATDDATIVLDLPEECYVGLFLCSHEEDVVETAHFRNVRFKAYETWSNPVFEGWYADPEGFVDGQTLWVYPTSSLPYKEQTYLDAWSTEDLVHWEKHPNILTNQEAKWVWQAMWAPSVVKKDGLYYLFFAGNDVHEGETGGIGVACSPRPEGPFEDLLGRPLIQEIVGGAQPIDQFVFQDPQSGDWYMYYGGWRHCNLVRLAPDFKSLIPFEDGEVYKEITPEGYVEGPFMLFKDGKYYFMWSEGTWTRDDYRVAYAIADTPFGPFRREETILQTDESFGTGAGHHSVVQDPRTGAYLIVYHRHPLGSTDGNHRVVCVDYLTFTPEGKIVPVRMH